MCPTLSDPGLKPKRLLSHWDSPGKNTRGGCHALPTEELTQGLNPCLLHLLHCHVDSLPLAAPGKPKVLSKWLKKYPWILLSKVIMLLSCIWERTFKLWIWWEQVESRKMLKQKILNKAFSVCLLGELYLCVCFFYPKRLVVKQLPTLDWLYPTREHLRTTSCYFLNVQKQK